MSQSIDNRLNQIFAQLNKNNELVKEIGRSFETFKVGYNFWMKMFIHKTFSEEELEEIMLVEKAWYDLAFNMPAKQPLSLEQLELLSKYSLIDGAQMAHMVSRIEK